MTKTTQTRPETLADEALETAQGGFSIDPNGQRVVGDRTTKNVTAAGPGGGPHVKVFNGNNDTY